MIRFLPTTLFVVLAFLVASTPSPTHALGEACGPSNPPCPSDLICDLGMNVCVSPLVTPPAPSPAPVQPAPASGGGSTGSGPLFQPPGNPGGTLFQPPGNPGNTNVTLINPLNSGNCTPGSSNCLMNFLNSILALVIRIGTVVVVLMLVFVGYKFVVAEGEPGKISEAREMLLWTVVGALVLLGAQAISYGISATVAALSVGQ